MTLIETEAQLLQVFGEPTDENYEYWYCLQLRGYGGVAYVIRCDAQGQTMKNASSDGADLFIKNRDHFEETFDCNYPRFYSLLTPILGDALGVAVIDRGADFVLKLSRPVSSPLLTVPLFLTTLLWLPDRWCLVEILRSSNAATNMTHRW